MNLDLVRSTLAGRMQEVHGANTSVCDLFIEGRQTPDLPTQTEPFITFSVDLPDIRQAGMQGGAVPQRGFSTVRLGLYARTGSGTKPMFEMLEIARTAFATQVVGQIRLYGLTNKKREPAVGWQAWSVTIPLQFDSLS
jgi:hypothetical protein